MINKFQLKNFKIHSDLDIEFGNITILTGQNGMGKSSVMQSLLLLRQSYLQQPTFPGANLKGDLVNLGSVFDVECQACTDPQLYAMLQSTTGDLKFQFSYDKDVDDKDVDLSDTFLPVIDRPDPEAIQKCALFTKEFQYISAFRLGPQRSYERDTSIVQHQKQISKVNGQCEYTVHFLSYFGNKIHCIPELVLEGTENDFLDTQVESWMQNVSPRVKVVITPEGNDFKLKYKYTREGELITDEMSAVNVGYGISYVLPVVVAILSATPGSLIMIENPEAHIHPRAQAELMKLLMKAAKAGIQIIIETHSDHIMNGVLVSIVKEPELLSIVKAYYFDRDDRKHTSIPIQLEILPDGRISNPPRGFFDQIDIDMRTIMGL